MKKRMLSFLLSLTMMTQMFVISSFALTGTSWEEPQDPNNFAGMTLRYVKPDKFANGNSTAGKNVFALEIYTVNQPLAAQNFVAVHTDNVALANKNTGKEVTADNNTMWYASGMVVPSDEVVEYYNENVANITLKQGEPIEICLNEVGIFEFGNYNFIEDKEFGCGLTKQTGLDGGLKDLWLNAANKTQYDPADGGGKVHLATMYMVLTQTALDAGLTIDNITPDQIFTSIPNGDFLNDDAEAINVVGGKSVFHLENFNVPAVAPTNVSISADKTSAVAGDNVKLTVSADEPSDGGTLSYAYVKSNEKPTELSGLSFQASPEFTVQAEAGAKYWGVVKNTKTDGGDSTEAYAVSNSSVSVNVVTGIASAAVTVVPPVAEATAAAPTVTSNSQYEYTSSSWTPALTGNAFAGSTAYKQTITLTAKSGYCFTDSTTVSLTGTTKQAANIVSTGAMLKFDVTYDATGKSSSEMVAAAKAAITASVGTSFAVDQKVANPGTEQAADATTATDIKTAIEAKLTALNLNGVTTEVGTPTISKAAVPGKPSNAAGTNGAYTAAITIKASGNASVKDTFTISSGVITAQAASQYHQNLAAVNTAKTAIENALNNKTVAQSEANNAAAIKSLVEAEIAKLNLNGVTATVNAPSGTPAVAGVWNDQSGTNGSFAVTVALSKGTVDGTWTGSGDNNTDYKAAATTASKAITVTATAFAAKKTADGTVSVMPGFEELAISWTAPQANVPVDHYELTVSKGGAPVEGYNAKPMGTSTSVTVTGLENGQTYDVTVKSVFKTWPESTKLLDDAAAAASGAPVAGELAPITMGGASKVEGNTATYENGTVQLTWNGAPLDFDQVRENFMVSLRAVPKDGFKFTGWTRTKTAGDVPSLDEAESFSFDDTGVTSSTANPLYVKVNEASTYTPTFETVAVVTEGNPKLQNLKVNAPDGRRLIQEDTTAANYDRFASDKLNYTVYLTKDETKVTLLPAYAMDLYNLKYNDGSDHDYTEPTADPDKPDIDRTGAPIELTLDKGTASKDVTFTLTDENDTGKTTTYTVTLKHVDTNPQMVLELDAAKSTKLATMVMRIKSAAFESGDFSINLTEKDVTPTGGGTAVNAAGFASFANVASGAALADGVYDAAAVCENVSSLISVDKYEVTNNGKTLNLTLSSKTGTPITFDADGDIVLKFKLLQNDNAMEGSLVDVDLLPTIEINKGSQQNTMSETFFSDGLDYVEEVEGTTAVAVEDRLVYLKVMDKYNIVAYVAARPNYKLVNFNIFDVNNANKQINDTPILLEQGDKLLYKTGDGTYKIEIQSNGFLTYKLDGLKVAGKRVDLDAISLIAGDVNGDGVINAADRTALVSLLGAVVDTDDGSSKMAGDDATKYFADFNDDGLVNAKDLGKVIRNISGAAGA